MSGEAWAAVGAAADSIIGGGLSLIGQNMANKTNMALQRKQLNWNERMWHMQNQYNTPEAQMQRMRDAGIHPMLALEGMGGGNATQPAQGEAPAQVENIMEGFQNISPFETYMRIKNAGAGLENIQSETELKRADTKLKQFELGLKHLEGEEKKWFLRAYMQDFNENRKQVKLDTRIKELEVTQRMINIDLSNQESINRSIKNQSDMISLLYQEVLTTLQAANSYRQLEGTIIGNAISYKEWKYIHDYKMKMPTQNAIFGTVANIIAPEGTEKTKEQVRNGVKWLMQGFRQGIVRSGAHKYDKHVGGKIGAWFRGIGVPTDDDLKKFLKR